MGDDVVHEWTVALMPVLSPDDLQTYSFFADLQPEQLSQLLDRHHCSDHEVDQVLVMEQDWGESVFLLLSGIAKVRRFTSDGDEVVMSVLGAGDVFGEMAALDGAARSADVVALSAVRLLKLRGATFATLLHNSSAFALALARLEAERLRDLNQRFSIQASDATTRLLDALAYLARKSSSANDPQALIPQLAQRDLALLAGMARETASRTLSKLRSKGTVVEENGCLKLADLKPLIKRGLIAA